MEANCDLKRCVLSTWRLIEKLHYQNIGGPFLNIVKEDALEMN